MFLVEFRDSHSQGLIVEDLSLRHEHGLLGMTESSIEKVVVIDFD